MTRNSVEEDTVSFIFWNKKTNVIYKWASLIDKMTPWTLASWGSKHQDRG